MKVEPGQTEQTKNGWAKMRQVCAAMAINLKDAQSDECVSKAQAHILCVGQPLARPNKKSQVIVVQGGPPRISRKTQGFKGLHAAHKIA